MNNEIDYKALNIDPDILDAASQLLLGKAYFKAVYTDDNCSHAFKWIYRSAKQDNMEAQFRLADLFSLGQGVSKSYTDAYEWYTKAALQGYKKAQIRIFNLYQQDKKMHCRGQLNSGESEWNDPKFKEKNNVRELNEYRLKHYESKLNHAINYYTELFKTLKSGNQEDPITSFKLGFLYQYGYGVKKCVKLAIEYYKEAAEQGNRDAQYHLGYLYENGTEIKFNYHLALRWYRASATSGNIAAQNALGYFYEKGLATELNFEGAIYWYTKAANAGNSDSQLTLGRLYRKGEGVELDISQAIKWYTLAASQGSGAAQNCLNQLYQLGKMAQLSGIENNTGYVGEHQTKPTLRSKLQDDIEKMSSLPNITQLKKLVEHALRTDGNAMFTLGMKYYNGEDFTQDKEVGFQWIKKAAKAGLPKAEMKVAGMYYNGGDVVDQDYHGSSIWTAKLVKKKNSVAQCDLGLLYLHGKGVRHDPLEASKWFTKSADQGNAEAQCQFGLLRLEGLGLRKDTKEALEWFNKSALNGNTNALYKLAQFYETGKYVEKDVYRAIKLYEYAAKNGNWGSQFRLAEIFEKGELVDQDLQKAESYYELAANSFNEYQRYQLALKYMNGAFGYSDYVKAFELFKQIADETPYGFYNIFREPIFNQEEINDMRTLDMLILVSKRGGQEACYYIGHFYETGITNDWGRTTLLHPNYTEAIYWYSIAATNGNSRAHYRLGIIYEEGKGVEVDLDVAHNHYLEAYVNGNEDANYRLAHMYMNGKVVTQDLVKAYNLFTEAANKGYKKATFRLSPARYSENLQMLEAVANAGYVAVQYQLGVFYQESNNDEEALKWLTLASKGGITDAFYRLGVIYEELKENNQNYSKAIQLYSEAIKRNHEDAMYRLARIYHLGKSVKRDYEKAYDLYTRAAELGHTESSRDLDITSYSIGQSDSEDGETSLVKYSENLKDTILMIEFVARNGNVYLQHQLGTFYMTNLSHLNHNEAFKWYQMAASSENTDAIYQLGLLYENGQGTIQNYSMAYNLYTQAKEKEHRDAIYRLGIAYHYGLGVDINTSEAINCYIKAAELGSDESQYKLGKLFESGELVEKDSLKALEWYTKAYLNGNCETIKDLYQLYDEKPLELYFNERLFRILSNVERTYISDEDKNDHSNRQTYGSIYFKLGMMHLYNQGTAKNIAKALKQFLKAYYDYDHQEAKPFISLEYNSQALISQTTYLDNLNAYFEIKDQIPSEHQYKLGMLYYNGVQDVSVSHNISGNPDSALVLVPDHSLAFRYFKLASLNQYPDAQHQLGLMYLRGHGVIKSYQIALKWFTATSESMTPSKCYDLGVDFFHGDKAEQDYEIARIYLQRATKGYMIGVQSYLDVIHLKEIEKEHRKNNTMDQFEKEVENIDPTSLYDRGVALYKNSSEGVENHDISFFYIKKAAEKNHKKAIVELAMMYLEGRAVEKDENEAMKWIEKSIKVMDRYECYKQGLDFYDDKNYRISLLYIEKEAKENNGHAQAQLGLMYLQGLGVEKNHEQAMKWFEQSTMQLDSYDCVEKGKEFYKCTEVDNNYEIALLYLQKAAEENNGHAQAQLGLMYLQGLGVERNYSIAEEWIESSILFTDKYSWYDYSMIFCNGIEVEKNYTIALAFLRKAANQTYGPAQAKTGLMYLDGHGVSKNESEAMSWIDKSINNMDQYNFSAFYDIGFHLCDQHESGKHFEIGLLLIKQTAEKGYGLAQALLGEMYLEGKGVSKNQDEASKWIEKSVSALKSFECYGQGIRYYNGFNVEKNYSIAMLYLLAAKREDYTFALARIGIMYLEGHGVEVNEEKAMECFQQSINEMDSENCYRQGMVLYREHRYNISFLYIKNAAEAGYSKAQSQLGIMLLEGKATQKNQAQAMEWIEKPMETMNPNECYDQGMAFYQGTTVIKDYAISFRFMEKAAENHYSLAQAHMALFYYQGLGVDENKDKALEWVEKSIIKLRVEDCNEDKYTEDECTEDECNDNKWYGYEDEYYTQGMKFYDGTEVDPDHKIALLYLRKAAERYHGLALAQLALMHLEGTGVEKNYGTAMELIQKSMNEMKLDECYKQGMIFYHRTELENNYDIALKYLKRASKANAYAQAQLGYMYKNGIGVDQSHEEAARWLNIVENNYAGESRFCRSKIYHYGQAGMQDFSKAFTLYQEELGFFTRGFLLCDYQDKSGTLRGIGLLYEYGDGVTQDFKKAMEYYKRSILNKENLAAYYNIGLLYYYGKGFDQNYKEALLWFEKEADLYIDSQALHVFVEDDTNEASNMDGSSKRKYSLVPDSRIHGEVHYYIGLMYRNGYFVDQDEERAQNYFKMAHIYGVERAKNLIK